MVGYIRLKVLSVHSWGSSVRASRAALRSVVEQDINPSLVLVQPR